jgi:ribosomal protein L11 methyltransferase
VIGVDIDPDAIRVSKQNALKNKIAEACRFEEGSVIELLENNEFSQGSSLVVANIIAPILEKLIADGLDKLVQTDGTLILSGILKEQLPGIKRHLARKGFVISRTLEQEGWCGLLAKKTRGQ